jgi:hypothetical protein
MKNKGIKALGIIIAGVDIFMAFGWSFFDMMVRCKKKKKETIIPDMNMRRNMKKEKLGAEHRI